MHLNVATAIVAALASLVVAAPPPLLYTNGTAIPIIKYASLVNPDNTVDLNALQSHNAYVKAKIRRGLDKFERNTGNQYAAVRAQGIGIENNGAALELTGYKRVLWHGTITVGTSAASFTVDIDTGTAEFFVPSVTCDSSCDGHSRWDPLSQESSATPLDRSFDVKFADGGEASGILYHDSITIAGLTADKQTIGAADKYSSQLEKTKFPPDGRMGLAFHTLSPSGYTTILETLAGEGKVKEKVFSLKLTLAGGELYLGGSNRALYDGGFTYTKVTKQAFWQVKIQSIRGNGRMILRNLDAIVDTGANFVFGPRTDVFELHTILDGIPAPPEIGKGVYTFPCDKFPTVTLSFNGKQFPILDLNLGQVSQHSSDCISGIVELDDNTPFWIIGGVFLQGVYTAFDFGNKQVGFAKLSGSGSA